MSRSSPAVEKFIHQFASPLTALQSAVELLAHHYGQNDDQRLVDLIAALQRSTERLRQFGQQLAKHVDVEDYAIVVRVPIEVAQGSAHSSSPSPVMKTTSIDRAVLVGGGILDELTNVLLAAGWEVERVETGAHGLDRSRQRRPRLLVIANDVRDIEPVMCGQIARTDPEMRDIVVALVGYDIPPVRGIPLIDVQQPLLDQLQRLLATHHGERGLPRILLVDDEADICMILGQQLTNAGFVVVTAPDGATALRVITEQFFDLIILDRLLPDGDGLQVLQSLRATPKTRLIPVILLSEVSALDEKVRSLKLGADDYVVKPCSAAELTARIRSILRRSERESSLNPISRLPGNVVIEQVIRERLAQKQPFAVGYVDLDNFKGYNDHYGFFKGDAIILHTARLLADVVHWQGGGEDFLGHLGGDDFVLVTTLERLQRIGQAVIERFDATIPYFYSAEDRERGYILGHDRQGHPCRYPLLSLSIAVVPVAPAQYQQPYEIAMRAATLKRQSKQINGSCLLIDSPERGM